MELKLEIYKNHLKQIRELTKVDIKFNVATTSDLIRINIFNDENHRDVQNFLNDNAVKFYSLNSISERLIKYVPLL